jgi:hypothetical protein
MGTVCLSLRLSCHSDFALQLVYHPDIHFSSQSFQLRLPIMFSQSADLLKEVEDPPHDDGRVASKIATTKNDCVTVS